MNLTELLPNEDGKAECIIAVDLPGVWLDRHSGAILRGESTERLHCHGNVRHSG